MLPYFIRQIKNLHSLVLIPNSLEKSFSVLVGYNLTRWEIQVFQNSDFCMKIQVLSPARNTVHYCLWSDMFVLLIFEKNCHIWDNNYRLSVQSLRCWGNHYISICSKSVLSLFEDVTWAKRDLSDVTGIKYSRQKKLTVQRP